MAVVELTGEEKRSGEAVVLRPVVPVVLVGADRMPPEATIHPDIRRQFVVMAEQDRFAITPQHQFRRDGSVESPHRQRSLSGQVGVKFKRNIAVRIGLCTFLSRLDSHSGRKLRPSLVCPLRPRRTTFDWPKAAAQSRVNPLQCLIGLDHRSRIQ